MILDGGKLVRGEIPITSVNAVDVAKFLLNAVVQPHADRNETLDADADGLLLLNAVMQCHADRNETLFYNYCDAKPCSWCELAKQTLTILGVLK